jgi:hypothetical protein
MIPLVTSNATAKETLMTSDHATNYLKTKPKFTQWRQNLTAVGDEPRQPRPSGSRRAQQQQQESRLIREAVQQALGPGDNVTPSATAASVATTAVATTSSTDLAAVLAPIVGSVAAVAEAQLMAYMNMPQRRELMNGKVAVQQAQAALQMQKLAVEREKAAVELAELRAKRQRLEHSFEADANRETDSDDENNSNSSSLD